MVDSNCVVYIRVGINKSDPEITVKNQEEILKQFSKKVGFKVEKTFIDIGYSGIGFDRPQFKQMIKYIQTHEIKGILVKSMDRISRDMFEFIDFALKMREQNIDIYTLDLIKK